LSVCLQCPAGKLALKVLRVLGDLRVPDPSL
jgi:hypothetical protein